MIEGIGQRVADFVGTNGVKVVRAVQEVVPGLEPPHRRRRTSPAGVALAAGAAGVAWASTRRRGATGPSRKGRDGRGATTGERASTTARRAAGAARSVKDGVVDLTDKTRGELYDLAREASIAGRSSMTKEQLAKALSKARSA